MAWSIGGIIGSVKEYASYIHTAVTSPKPVQKVAQDFERGMARIERKTSKAITGTATTYLPGTTARTKAHHEREQRQEEVQQQSDYTDSMKDYMRNQRTRRTNSKNVESSNFSEIEVIETSKGVLYQTVLTTKHKDGTVVKDVYKSTTPHYEDKPFRFLPSLISHRMTRSKEHVPSKVVEDFQKVTTALATGIRTGLVKPKTEIPKESPVAYLARGAATAADILGAAPVAVEKVVYHPTTAPAAAMKLAHDMTVGTAKAMWKDPKQTSADLLMTAMLFKGVGKIVAPAVKVIKPPIVKALPKPTLPKIFNKKAFKKFLADERAGGIVHKKKKGETLKQQFARLKKEKEIEVVKLKEKPIIVKGKPVSQVRFLEDAKTAQARLAKEMKAETVLQQIARRKKELEPKVVRLKKEPVGALSRVEFLADAKTISKRVKESFKKETVAQQIARLKREKAPKEVVLKEKPFIDTVGPKSRVEFLADSKTVAKRLEKSFKKETVEQKIARLKKEKVVKEVVLKEKPLIIKAGPVSQVRFLENAKTAQTRLAKELKTETVAQQIARLKKEKQPKIVQLKEDTALLERIMEEKIPVKKPKVIKAPELRVVKKKPKETLEEKWAKREKELETMAKRDGYVTTKEGQILIQKTKQAQKQIKTVVLKEPKVVKLKEPKLVPPKPKPKVVVIPITKEITELKQKQEKVTKVISKTEQKVKQKEKEKQKEKAKQKTKQEEIAKAKELAKQKEKEKELALLKSKQALISETVSKQAVLERTITKTKAKEKVLPRPIKPIAVAKKKKKPPKVRRKVRRKKKEEKWTVKNPIPTLKDFLGDH